MNQKTNSEAVKEFTEGYLNIKCPEKPIAMKKEDVMFLIRMVMSEMDELMTTVAKNSDERDDLMRQALETRDKCKRFNYPEDKTLIASQADALVDSWYYSLNIAAKHGMNLSSIFDIIHQANMAKRDPKTGKFIRRESDGKVIKPEGWKEPDIEGVIEKQMENGSWN